jgi:kumamolisin
MGKSTHRTTRSVPSKSGVGKVQADTKAQVVAPPTTEKLAVVAGSRRVALAGARAIGPANPQASIEVTLKLRRKQALPELHTRPATPMTREQLAKTYGASGADIEKVSEVFAKFDLQTVRSDAATRTVRLSGTIENLQRAFSIRLFNYAHVGGNYRGRVGDLHVPAELKGIVEGVFGLDNRRVARRRRHPVRDGAIRRSLASVPASWYRSGELAKHYNYPAGDGAGQAVGLLEFGGGYFPDDLKEYCQLASISPLPTVKAVSTDGTSTSSKDGAEGEVMLDVEVVAGVCPSATIVVYFAEWTEQGWITALDAAIHDSENNPGVLSVSWGAPEDTDLWSDQAMKQIDQTLLEAAHLGITFCVAAGDDGSSDADMDGHAHVDFPASSPYALAVGGTTVPKANGQPDVGWFEGDGLRSDGGGSTGGGVSVVAPRPSWQSNIQVTSVNPGAMPGRVIPDLAANADWTASPYLLVVDGQAEANGGTSAASPLVASLIARLNASRKSNDRIGYLTPLLYQSVGTNGQTIGSLGCTDVVRGQNATSQVGGYAAGKGYDAVSGWGTPNGIKLQAALHGAVGPSAAPAVRVNGKRGAHQKSGGAAPPAHAFFLSQDDVDDLILNYDPETPQARFQAAVIQDGARGLSDRLPHPVPWPHNPPTAQPLDHAPSETQSLSRFSGYDAAVMTWTSAEAAALAALFTPNYLPSKWYEYRHNVKDYIPLVTGGMAPFNDKRPDMARYYHSLGLYFPCTIGSAKVLLFKSGLHFAYDGPAIPLKRLVGEIAQAVKPKVFITTGTAGGIGADVSLGDIVIGPECKFDCITTAFRDQPWAKPPYPMSPVPDEALDAITEPLLEVNAARLPNGGQPKVWSATGDTIVTTDFFGFDDSTDHYQLQGRGKVCEMGDAMVADALAAFKGIKRFAIRNASDPQIPDPSGNIAAAKKQAGDIYRKYGAFTTAGSAIATWAVIDAICN